jgi:prepilin-type N-terminal cleavage/methylation domain-containing protein
MVQRERGFSLIEVLVGLMFLAVGILALASLQVTSIRGGAFSSNLMQATYVVQEGLENLKNRAIDSTDLSPGVHNPGPVTLSLDGYYTSVVYNRSYTVLINGNLRTINYTVRWNDGIDHHITFSTIRSE